MSVASIASRARRAPDDVALPPSPCVQSLGQAVAAIAAGASWLAFAVLIAALAGSRRLGPRAGVGLGRGGLWRRPGCRRPVRRSLAPRGAAAAARRRPGSWRWACSSRCGRRRRRNSPGCRNPSSRRRTRIARSLHRRLAEARGERRRLVKLELLGFAARRRAGFVIGVLLGLVARRSAIGCIR